MTHRGILLASTFLVLMAGVVWWTWGSSPRVEAVLPTPAQASHEDPQGASLEPVVQPLQEPADDRSGTPVLERPEGSFITGTVVGLGGLPVAWADVVVSWTGLPAGRLHTVGTSDPEGRFSVDRDELRDGNQLVLGAHHEDWLPATLVLPPPPEEGYSDLVLQLRQGYGIEGQVLRGGTPLQGARLKLTGPEPTGRKWFLADGLDWVDGRFERRGPSAVTSEEGRFAFKGLHQGPHRLTIDPPGVSIPRTEFRDLVAPDPAVRIDLVHAELALTVVDQEGPLLGAEIVASCVAEQAKLTSGPVRVLLRVPEHRKVRFLVRHPTVRDLRRVVVAPSAGEQLQVEFQVERVPRPALQVTLPGAAGLDLQHLRLRFLDGDREVVLDQRLARVEEADFFLLNPLGLEPGTYTLELRADREGNALFLQPQDVSIEVPESGRIEASFEPRMNGRYDLGVTLQTGDIQRVDYVLRQGGSEPPVERRLVERQEEGRVLVGGQRVGPAPNGGRVYHAMGLLPPGEYEVEIHVQYLSGSSRTLSGSLHLTPLETTSIDFDAVRQE